MPVMHPARELEAPQGGYLAPRSHPVAPVPLGCGMCPPPPKLSWGGAGGLAGAPGAQHGATQAAEAAPERGSWWGGRVGRAGWAPRAPWVTEGAQPHITSAPHVPSAAERWQQRREAFGEVVPRDIDTSGGTACRGVLGAVPSFPLVTPPGSVTPLPAPFGMDSLCVCHPEAAPPMVLPHGAAEEGPGPPPHGLAPSPVPVSLGLCIYQPPGASCVRPGELLGSAQLGWHELERPNRVWSQPRGRGAQLPKALPGSGGCLWRGAGAGGERSLASSSGDFCPGEKSPQQGLVLGDLRSRAAPWRFLGTWL